MNCPRCGIECDAAAQTCFSCGWVFADGNENGKPHISKLAVLSLIFGMLCLFTLFLPLLPAIIIGILAIRRIRRSSGRLTGERLAMAGIVIPLLCLPIVFSLLYVVWRKDAPPVPNEFTEADLVTVRPENEPSWELLRQLNDQRDDPNGAPAIGLANEDIELLDTIFEAVSDPNNSIQDTLSIARDYQDDISRLWQKGQKGIDIIHRLSAFDEIADLSEPSMTPEYIAIDDLKWLSRLVNCFVLNQAAAGNLVQAINELNTYNSLIRKRSVSTRSVIAELVCYAGFVINLESVSVICGDPNVSESALRMLQNEFAPLNEKEVALENPLICEYLGIKDKLIELQKEQGREVGVLKMNSSLRYFQSYIQRQILFDSHSIGTEHCPISVWPWEKPNWPKVKLTTDINWLYVGYNPAGYMFVQIVTPAYEKVYEIKTKVLVRDDLFQWILARRLGQEGSLKARAYSDQYTVDIDKQIVFSVGSDGEPYTDDDIKMRINSEVLGLK